MIIKMIIKMKGKIAKKNSLKECVFVNCHVVKNTFLLTVFSVILHTGLFICNVEILTTALFFFCIC